MSTYPVLDQKDTRSGFGAGLLELGSRDERVVALCADLTGSLKMDAFAKKFPERFFQVGVAEANMMGMAAGLTIGGKIPFTGTFANFSTGRVYDQIRQSIAYAGKNVKICASHAGLTLGEDGATHQILEDIGLMRMLPGMTVIVPCDFNQTKQATIAIGAHEGPVYLRFGRPKWPVFIPADMPFEIGKAQRLIEGADVSVFACGHLVWKALQAAEELAKRGISAEVINVHTIKPLDEEAVLASVRKTKCVVTCEEHNRFGGLGDTIAQVLVRHAPTPQEYVAVNDSFGESGTPDQLLKKYGLDTPDIVKAVEKVMGRKSDPLPPVPVQERPRRSSEPMSEELSDEALLAMFAREDSRHYAFNLIVRKHQRRLYSFVRRMVTDHDETQDVLQNIFIKAWQGLVNFRGDAQLYSWLYRIAHNESITHLNRMKRGLFTSDEAVTSRLTSTLDSSDHFNGDAIQKKLQQAVMRLPTKQRAVFNMKYFEEMKYEEMSRVTGTSVGALKASYHIATKKIEEWVTASDQTKGA